MLIRNCRYYDWSWNKHHSSNDNELINWLCSHMVVNGCVAFFTYLAKLNKTIFFSKYLSSDVFVKTVWNWSGLKLSTPSNTMYSVSILFCVVVENITYRSWFSHIQELYGLIIMVFYSTRHGTSVNEMVFIILYYLAFNSNWEKIHDKNN